MFDIFGCTDPLALNHNPDATDDDGSCDYNHSECVYPPEFVGNTGSNMTVFLTSGVVSALPLTSADPYIVALTGSGLGCRKRIFLAQNDLIGGQQSLAVWGDDSSTPEVDGALTGEELFFQLVDGNSLYDLDISFADPNSYTTNAQLPAIGVTNNFVCSQDTVVDIFGCMDMSANNYNPDATVDNGSCMFDIFGCTDPLALNHNPDATDDDGSCEYEIIGCTDMSANNYNPDATVDNGSCIFDIFGCTDPLALNHNPDATDDDGSCDYNHSECVYPPEFVGNTGSNMTVFLTSE